MKTLTAGQEAARAAGGVELFRFLKFEWPGGPTRYYSERSAAVAAWSPDASKTFYPCLHSFPMSARKVSLGVEESFPAQDVTFQILVDTTDASRVDVLLTNDVPLGSAVTLYEVLRPLTGSASESDWICLGRYVVRGYTSIYEAPARVEFRCADWLQDLAGQEIGRTITDDLYPLAPTGVYGGILPHLFGTVEGAPLPLVAAAGTQRTTLDESIDEAELQIVVADGSALAASGTVLIDGEEIAYQEISGNTITATERGASGTVAAGHSYGATVTQILDRYTFAVADHAVVGVSNLRINGMQVDSANVTAPYVDANGVTVVDLVGKLPEITEPGASTSQLSLEDLDTPPIWGEGDENTATSATEGWAQAVDSGDNRHVTFCRLPDGTAGGSVLHLKQTNDLSTNNGTIKKVKLAIEYQATNGGANGWPSDRHPYFYLIHGATTLDQALAADETEFMQIASSEHFAASGGVWVLQEYIQYETLNTDVNPPRLVGLTRGVNGVVPYDYPADVPVYHVAKGVEIASPPEEDLTGNTDLYPEDLEGSNSTELFNLEEGSIGSQVAYDAVYVSGYALITGDACIGTYGAYTTIEIIDWPGLSGMSEGSSLSYPRSSTEDLLGTVLNCRGRAVSPLVLKLDSPTGTTKSLSVKFSVSGDARFSTDISTGVYFKQTVVGKVEIGSKSQTGSVLVTRADTKTFTVTLTGDFDQADLESARISIWAASPLGTGNWGTENSKLKFTLNSIEVAGEGDFAFVGNGTPLDSSTYVSSNRITQQIDISEDVLAAGGWPWFTDDTSLMVAWPDDSSAMDLLVYRLGMDLEVLSGSTRRVTEETVEAVADVVAQAAPYRSYKLLRRLLTGADYFGLADGTDYSDAQMVAACLDAEAMLLGGMWTMARRIDKRTPLRERLESAVTDAGIRLGMDGGRLVFFPRITGSAAANVRTLTRNDMLTAPEGESANVELIWNEIAVYYAREMSGTTQGFQSVTESSSPESMAKSWGTRRYTYDAEWVRKANVAASLAARLAGDFAAGRVMQAVTVFSGLHLDLEVGDCVGLTDSYARLTGAVGRIVGVSRPMASQVRLTVAYPIANTRVRVWEDAGSGSYIDAYPTEGLIRIVVDGVEVGQLTSGGLRIAGEINETAWDPDDSEAALIVYDGTSNPHAIVFNVFETGGTYYRAMALDKSGDLRVSELRELGDYFPLTTAHTFAAYIELADDGEDEVWTVDLAREFLRVANVDVGSEINGELQAKEVTEHSELV
jgi:hypothetical protein